MRTRLVLFAFALTACQSEWPADEAQDYQVIGRIDLLASDSALPSVAVVVAPDECLECSANIGSWLELRRKYPGHIRIVFSSPPDSTDLFVLRRGRIPIDAILSRRLSRRLKPPVVAIRARSGEVGNVEPASGRSVIQATRLLSEHP
jgi:hypothetical protein